MTLGPDVDEHPVMEVSAAAVCGDVDEDQAHGEGTALSAAARSSTSPTAAFLSWDAYLAETTTAERLAWCRSKAKTANRRGGGARVTAAEVLAVLEAARGRCWCCDSLAVERLPPPPERGRRGEAVDRRVGSLEHRVELRRGGGNELANLAWSCQWCNANYHGGRRPIRRSIRPPCRVEPEEWRG